MASAAKWPTSTALVESWLYLPNNALRFEPVSVETDVFYDELNQQVFAVHERGSGGVEVLSPLAQHQLPLFRIVDKGPIISIKFSHDIRILAIQRNAKSVEFCNYFYDRHSIDTTEYSQTCRSRSSKIIGFAWTGARQLIFVTDSKWEVFEVQPNKHALRALKSFSMHISWFLYHPPYFVVANGPHCTHLEIYYAHHTVAAPYLFNKIDVDLHVSYSDNSRLHTNDNTAAVHSVVANPPVLLERDVALTTLYSGDTEHASSSPAPVYLMIIRQAAVQERSGGAEIVLYYVPPLPQQPYVSHVLALGVVGRFAVNVLDNVLIVHHQQSKTSALFDIKSSPPLPGPAASTGGTRRSSVSSPSMPSILQPLFKPRSIRPHKVHVLSSSAGGALLATSTSLSSVRARSKERAELLLMAPSSNDSIISSTTSSSSSQTTTRLVDCALYASTWAVFYPNVIVDAKLGCFWELQLDYAALLGAVDVKKPQVLVEFLSNRTAPAAKHLLLALPAHVLLLSPQSVDAGTGKKQHDPSCIKNAACLFDALFSEICRLNNPASSQQLSASTVVEHKNNGNERLQISTTTTPSPSSQSKSAADSAAAMPPSLLLQPLTVLQIFTSMLTSVKRCKQETSAQFFVTLMLDLLRSATRFGVDVPFAFHELLATTLLDSCKYTQLQYLLQYRILAHSKRMACLLLANSSRHRPMLQTAFDMLTRLEAHEEIIDILLSQQKILTALRYAEQRGVSTIDSRKFLQSAYETGDKDLFYTVYNYFERLSSRNPSTASSSSSTNRRKVGMPATANFQDLKQFESLNNAFQQMFVNHQPNSNATTADAVT